MSLIKFSIMVACLLLCSCRTIDVLTDPVSPISRLTFKAVNESSGIAESTRYGIQWDRGVANSVLYTHNDSGDGPRFFAFLSHTGRSLGEFTINGARAVDWEDMCSFKLNGKSYLLFADFGDNGRRRRLYTLYVVEEPRLTMSNTAAIKSELPLVASMSFMYAEGASDAESIAVDRVRGEIVVLTKQHNGKSSLYVMPLSLNKTAILKPERQMEIVSPLTTGMDISRDGRFMVISTYTQARVYERRAGESWADALSRPPVDYAIPARRQGESICFSADARTLFLSSEGRPCPIYAVPFAMPVE